MEGLAKNFAYSTRSVSITKLHMVTPCHFAPYCTFVDSFFFFLRQGLWCSKGWPGTSERFSSPNLLNFEIIDRHHHPDPELLTTSGGNSTVSVSILRAGGSTGTGQWPPAQCWPYEMKLWIPHVENEFCWAMAFAGLLPQNYGPHCTNGVIKNFNAGNRTVGGQEARGLRWGFWRLDCFSCWEVGFPGCEAAWISGQRR